MPQPSALVLLQPPPPVTPQSSSYQPSSDLSFQDSLDVAQQRQSASSDDSDNTKSVDASAKTDKPAKKIAKPSKSKNAKVPVKNGDADNSEEAIANQTDALVTLEPTESTASEGSKNKATETRVKNPAPTKEDAVAVAENPPMARSADIATTTQTSTDTTTARKPAVVKSLASNPAVKKDDTDAAAKDTDQDESTDAGATALVADAQTKQSAALKPAGFGTEKMEKSGADPDSTPQPVVHPQATQAAEATPTDTAAAIDGLPAAAEETDADPHATGTPPAVATPLATPTFDQQLQHALAPQSPKAETPAPPTAQPQFAEANHPNIVTGVNTQLLPTGGTMQLRLDPPELGALQITVQMKNGVMSAAFETSNDQASKMLSHSLGQLKTALESSGLTVEKMHVQQAPRQESSNNNSDSQQQHPGDAEQQQQARQDQQRRQMLQRMWSKLAGVEDPLDLVA